MNMASEKTTKNSEYPETFPEDTPLTVAVNGDHIIDENGVEYLMVGVNIFGSYTLVLPWDDKYKTSSEDITIKVRKLVLHEFDTMARRLSGSPDGVMTH